MTVNEKNTKEIENKSQGTALAPGDPQRPERRASRQNARLSSKEMERKSWAEKFPEKPPRLH
jgi:hypothetical protein